MATECSPDRLIIYARWPAPGLSKTRLGEAIAWDEAAGVYARLLYGYLYETLSADARSLDVELSLASKDDVPFFAAAFPECVVRPQIEGTLGAHLLGSFRSAFAEGAQRVVLTGSDIPTLGPALVCQALDALERVPMALGPASDGGTYMVAMQSPGADILQGITWSSPKVLAQTLERAAHLGQQVTLLPELRDLDNGWDSAAWQRQVVSPS